MKKLVNHIEQNGLLGKTDDDYDTSIINNTGETLVLALEDKTDGAQYVVMISRERHEHHEPQDSE